MPDQDHAPPPASAGGTPIPIQGLPDDDAVNLSALAVCGPWLAVAGDEGRRVYLLERAGSGWRVDPARTVTLGDAGTEADLEALALDGRTLYAIGSHAAVRKSPRAGRNLAETLERLAPVESDPARDKLYRLRFDADWRVADVDAMSLAPALEDSRILRRFRKIPSKENGIDIEGLAFRDGRLWVGFRGPVLRGGLALVLAPAWGGKADDGDLSFLRLAGLGIRDLAAVSDGFLVLAGPVGDAPGPWRILHWNGENALAPEDRLSRPEPAVPLMELTPAAGAKPEGLAIISEGAAAYEALMVMDGDARLWPLSVPRAG